MEKRALIFGHSGQDGYYLKNLLQQQGFLVRGVSRRAKDFECDITDFDSVCALFKDFAPRYIFNFSAISTTSHEAYFENHKTIGTGTVNLLEAVRLVCPSARVFLAGSGLQFVNMGKPISETDPLEANSAYAAVRNYSYYLARYFRASYGLQVYYGFFFTHDSPKRSPKHMSQKIVLAACSAAKGSLNKLEIGALDVRKEYLFAGDAMKAVWKLITQNRVYEAVIGNGEDHSIAEWVECCFGYVGLDWKQYVIQTAGFTPEYPRLVSKPCVIKSLGWAPSVSFSDLAKMMMEAQL